MSSAFHAALLTPAAGTPNVGDNFIEDAIRRQLSDDVRYSRFSTRRPLTEADIAAINDCDCVLVCGTNLYQHDWHSALEPAVVRRIAVPVIPFGMGSSAASLDELDVSRETREMIALFHSRCALGGVRDPHTAAVVSRIGVTNARLTGCPVLFWSGRESLPDVESRPRRRLVVTARNWLMHRWPDNVNHPVQIQFLGRILESFPAHELVFAIHEDWDAELVDELRIPDEIVFRSDSVQDYVRLYTDPENVVLGMRLHAGMLALANGVPTLLVGHDTRTYSFCRMMGLPYVELFDEDCPGRAVAALRLMLDGDGAPPPRVAERYEELRAAMKDFLRVNGLPARG